MLLHCAQLAVRCGESAWNSLRVVSACKRRTTSRTTLWSALFHMWNVVIVDRCGGRAAYCDWSVMRATVEIRSTEQERRPALLYYLQKESTETTLWSIDKQEKKPNWAGHQTANKKKKQRTNQSKLRNEEYRWKGAVKWKSKRGERENYNRNHKCTPINHNPPHSNTLYQWRYENWG